MVRNELLGNQLISTNIYIIHSCKLQIAALMENHNTQSFSTWQRALSILFAGDKSRSGRVKASELDYDDVKLLKESILFFPLNFLGHIYLSSMKKKLY